jgi:hypothetical protein
MVTIWTFSEYLDVHTFVNERWLLLGTYDPLTTITAGHLKLASPPPYLSICNTSSSNSIYLKGVNFASGGAGVSSQTNKVKMEIRRRQIAKFNSNTLLMNK